MTDKIEISDTNTSGVNRGQSEMFEDAFLRNLKGLQGKIKQQHVQNEAAKSGDMQYIGDNTKKLIELKLLELDSVIMARKKEEEWLRKREIRQAQKDRLDQARQNLSTLMYLEDKGKRGLEDAIEANLSILDEVSNIGGEEIYVDNNPANQAEKILDSFHVTEKDLKRALNADINVLEVIRNAKENGWTMKIINDEIALYGKDGKRITGDRKSKGMVGEKPRPKTTRKRKAAFKKVAKKKTSKTSKTSKISRKSPNKVKPKRNRIGK